MLSRTIRHLPFLALLLIVSWSGRLVHAHGVTLIVQHASPADSALHTQFLLPWLKQLENDSAGLLRFRPVPASPEDKLVNRVETREADIVIALTRAAPGRFPAIEAFEALPVQHSAPGASRGAWEYARMNDLAENEFDGLRLLAVAVAPGAGVTDVYLLIMNGGAYQSLTEDLRKVLLARSGEATSASMAHIVAQSSPGGTQPTPAATEAWFKRATERGVNVKALAQSAREFLTEYDTKK